MIKTYFADVEETTIQIQLENGLQVILIPKNDYHRVYGILTTNFGSIDTSLRHKKSNEIITLPAGTAHFLEHKMFEGMNGEDAFVKFMRQGAEANAFTTHFQTSFLFSASFEINKNIETLLDFVQEPTFSPEGVEKEKKIIEQELLMYLDDPYWRIHQLVLEGLYPNHPAGVDVGGTIETVNKTSYEDLKLAYESFYHPSQMCLIILGDFDIEDTITAITQNQLGKVFPHQMYERVSLPVTEATIAKQALFMDVSQPLVALGFRFKAIEAEGEALLKKVLEGEILADLIFGPTTTQNQIWYEKEWIDSSFDYVISIQRTMHYLHLSVSSHYEKEILSEWESVFNNWQNSDDLNEEHFETMIKGKMGDLLQMLNSMEYTAYSVIDSVFENYNSFNALKYLKEMTLEDVIDYGKEYWGEVSITQAVILPNA